MSQHFWLLCGIWCGLGNGALIWFRRRKYVEAELLSEEQVASFAKGTVFWLLLPCLLLWALQQSSGGSSSPEYWRWPLPQRYGAFALQAFVWLALAYWVFVKDGANTLSAYFSVGSKSPAFLHSPLAMKMGTILTIVTGIIALLSAQA
jgi:hypothetical protein